MNDLTFWVGRRDASCECSSRVMMLVRKADGRVGTAGTPWVVQKGLWSM